MEPPQTPPAPPAPPSPPLPPPRPPLQPGSQYVRSSSEVVTALQDPSIDRIVLATGVYEFADSMCFTAASGNDADTIGSAFCIDRTVTIEAMDAGTVELDAKGQRRVISIGSAGVATLIGLSITGGFSTKGGGLYVEAGGIANVERCDVHKNQANNGGGLFIVAGGKASMVGSNIYENTALAANGGGLVIWGTAELTNCDIYENDAPGTFGGGLYVGGGATAELADCRLYENTAETGGGLYNNGKLTLQTSLLERNTGPDGAQLSLAGGSELIYILPVPLGHYLDGAVMCQEQMCKVDISCDQNCDLEPCPTQFCDADVLGGKYIKAYRPQTKNGEAINEQFPMACQAGVQGSSSDMQHQSSPFCAGACLAGFYCPLGTWQPVPCAVGRYSRGGAKTAEECPSCPAGSVANATGMGECTQCAAGTFQEEEGEQACIACKPGSFCPEGASAPLPCKEGSYSNATNLTSAKDCTRTDPGHFAPTGSTEQTKCSPGTVAPYASMGTCLRCEAGTFQAEPGQLVCGPCTPGSYCSEGAAAALPCKAGTYQNETMLQLNLVMKSTNDCVECPAGSACGTGAEEPSSCSPGTVQPDTGKATCDKCAAGKYQPDEGNQTCVACRPGSYCPEGASAPLPCKEGSYSEATNVTRAEDCIETDAGHFAPTGSTEQTPCSPGTVQPDTGKGTCLPCVAGSFINVSGQSACLECPAGFVCTTQATAAVPCPGGTFGNSSGLRDFSECEDVPPGFFCSGRKHRTYALPFMGLLPRPPS